MMKIKIFAISAFVLLLIIICFNVSCKSKQEKVPALIPTDAIWVGGGDGGAYILIKETVNEEKGLYFGEVYFENGEIWYKGNFSLLPKVYPVLNYKNQNIFTGWDGDNIYLDDGRYLKALK